jgi:thiol-disulfide isomerase/thioredoxin
MHTRPERMRAWLSALLVFLVLFGLLKLFNRWSLAGNALEVGTPVAAFSLPDASGKPFRLPTAGREVLINYWASWCQPCVAEMPILQDFAQRNAANGTQVVGIALEVESDSRAWLSAHPVAYPMVFEPPGATDSSVSLGNARGLLPYSVLVGADGRVMATRTGPFADAADLEGWLESAR